MAHQGQPDSQAAMGARAAAVGLAKALEDVRQEFGVDADAVVGDAKLNIAIVPLERSLNPTTALRELYGIGQQIPDDLLHPVGIAGYCVAGAIKIRVKG